MTDKQEIKWREGNRSITEACIVATDSRAGSFVSTEAATLDNDEVIDSFKNFIDGWFGEALENPKHPMHRKYSADLKMQAEALSKTGEKLDHSVGFARFDETGNSSTFAKSFDFTPRMPEKKSDKEDSQPMQNKTSEGEAGQRPKLVPTVPVVPQSSSVQAAQSGGPSPNAIGATVPLNPSSEGGNAPLNQPSVPAGSQPVAAPMSPDAPAPKK